MRPPRRAGPFSPASAPPGPRRQRGCASAPAARHSWPLTSRRRRSALARPVSSTTPPRPAACSAAASSPGPAPRPRSPLQPHRGTLLMSADPIVIASYARTPMGGFQGSLAGASATQLGAAAVRAAVDRAGVAGEQVDQIVMGCVLPAGLGQAPARQAALGAGLPNSVPATTVNKMCGSGLQAAILAHDALKAGSADIIVAGGMESMSN